MREREEIQKMLWSDVVYGMQDNESCILYYRIGGIGIGRGAYKED